METTDYLTARILSVKAETSDVSTYQFAVEGEKEFSYLPGQFDVMGLPGFEEAPLSFSAPSEPGTGRFTHTVRHVGKVTRRLSELEVGAPVMIRGPFGRGWPVEEMDYRDVLLVAGGIGLPPVRPLILHGLVNRDRLRKFVLIFGARSPEELIFRDELASWQADERIATFYCVDRLNGGDPSPLNLSEGLVTQFLEDLGLDPFNTAAYVCGPEIMMRFVSRSLLRQGFAGNRIFVSMERRMRCGTAHCGHCQIGAKFVCRDGPVFEYSDIARFSDTLL